MSQKSTLSVTSLQSSLSDFGVRRPLPQARCDPGQPVEVGIFLSCWRNTPGAYAMQAIVDEWKAGGAVKDRLGETAKVSKTRRGTVDTIMDLLEVGSLEQPGCRAAIVESRLAPSLGILR